LDPPFSFLPDLIMLRAMPCRFSGALLAAAFLSCAVGACGDDPPQGYQPPLGGGTRDVFVVAHQDDDLLFMNPDLSARLRAGHTIDVVYVTAGDAGHEQAVWSRREAGVRAAYAAMAGESDVWNETDEMIAGEPVVRESLAARPWIRLTFLRLPDGNIAGRGFGHGSLLQLWNGQLITLPVMGDSAAGATYSHEQIVSVLVAILEDAHADALFTLDSTGLYSPSPGFGDHTDHVVSARLALEASLAYATPHRLSLYRTYNISDLPANLSEAQFEDKRATFLIYDFGAVYAPAYGLYMARIAAIRALRPFRAPLVAASGCLVAGASGEDVVTRPCAGGRFVDAWTLDERGGLHAPGAAGRCLDARGTPHLARCDASVAQTWRVLDDGQIRGVGAACLDAGVASDGHGSVALVACAQTEAQHWDVRPSGG
jgi:LmbE family N-acetylglucosaminyl deacetylase